MRARAIIVIALLTLLPTVANAGGAEFQVNTTASGSLTNPRLAVLTSGHLVATWSDGGGVFAQIFTPSGAKIGGEIEIDAAGSNASVAALASGKFIVAWRSATHPSIVFAQVFKPDGTKARKQITRALSGNGLSDTAVAGTADGGFIVEWQFNSDIGGQRYDAETHPVGEAFVISAHAVDSSMEVAMLTGGGFVTTWLGHSTSAPKVGWASVFSTDGAKVQEFSAGQIPAVTALSDGRFAVAFTHDPGPLYSRIYTDDGTASEGRIRTSSTGDATRQPSLTGLPDGGFVVTWTGHKGLTSQQVDSSGSLVGTSRAVNITPFALTPIVVAIPTGGYTVIWRKVDHGENGLAILGRTVR